MQTTSLIGRRCKRSNTFSWPILIDRGLEPPMSFTQCEWRPTTATVGYKQEFKRKVWVSGFDTHSFTFFDWSRKSVILLQRVHLFPFRTQKLSSAMAKILAWRRVGKIAQCWYTFQNKFWNRLLAKRAAKSANNGQQLVFFRRGSTCSHSEHRS